MAPRSTSRPDLCAVLFLFVLGHQTLAQIVNLEVKDGNSTCIKAELSAQIAVVYSVTNGTRTASMPLPASTTVGSDSSCGGSSGTPWLMASFGDGHSLSLGFSSNGSLYRVENITVVYNLSDTSNFPASSSKDRVTVMTAHTGILARMNTTYKCESNSTVILSGGGVNVSFSNMRIEAYMLGSEFSVNETVCTADQTATTTSVPKTSAVTTPPTPTVPGTPEQGKYNVTNSNGSVCLLAYMGLQLNITLSSSQNKTVQEIINLQPNLTKSTGLCEVNSSTLFLTSDRTNLTFFFSLNVTKYHLSGISVRAILPDMKDPFATSNVSLDYLRGTLGRSYMCNAEQTLLVDKSFSLNTFHVQVQPFRVNGGQFENAEDCHLDEDNMLIPIIVGAALAGLVLIVLIAYLIGRKRSHAGYQTI
ncbi:lysosomal-associated membrane protein 1 precursor-like [Scleropages formosus]|uniref:Lysosome-associated membrane glycoprotein 1 n=1 Tax=Scleropages formosus TaxID=113540 RepID=A0A0P7UF30_SCLFO|nr:lysosome-associated membrane glycoprotein 1 [Scleropages formosus]KPP72884.1 lysosomal-associated membrane protein 1 precursor-like [Scleropages formosus]